jgi:oxygen-independent coproporphyrinogen-3 oxidase
MDLPPLSLYIHIPWCVRKCPYCDFNSHAVSDEMDESLYVDALLKDIAMDVPLAEGRPLQSIFIGGGTPSLFSPSAIYRLLSSLEDYLELTQGIEITMEANPGTLEASHFEGYREAGVNRLSIGVQSFHDASLKALGRIHTSAEAMKAIEGARAAGFDRINLDLMFGLPDQSREIAMEDLHRAIECSVEHISYYQLTLEPNTLFHHQPPDLPEEDLLWEIQQSGQELLQESGYRRYEVSAFARPGAECRHNLNYWRFGDYLGVGAGAHGKLSRASGVIQRHWKPRQPTQYISALSSGSNLAGSRVLQREDKIIEFMMNALRLPGGVEQELFTLSTGLPEQEIDSLVSAATESKLLHADGKRLQPTSLGLRFLNDLLQFFEVSE